MTYEIELFHPSAKPGGAAQTESLGECKIVTKNVFVTITEHSGDAHLVLLDEIVSLDRTQPAYVTVSGRTSYPRRIDLPAKIYVEMPSGYARAIAGDAIARLVLVRRDTSNRGRVSW